MDLVDSLYSLVGTRGDDYFDDGVHACIELVETYNDWISCGDDKPSHNDIFQVWTTSGFDVASFIDGKWRCMIRQNDNTVTHWRNLPKSPE